MIVDKSSEIVLFLLLVSIMYLAIFGLIAADLWAGVRKAKMRGEMRTSDAYKRTITKIAKYYNMAFALSLVDGTQSALIFYLNVCYGYVIPMIPIFTFLGTLYIGFVEIRSVTEPADVKERKQQEDFKRMLLNIINEKDNTEKLMTLMQSLVKKDKNESI